MVVVDLLYILQIWINGLFKWLIYQYIKHLNTTKEKAIWCMKCLKVVVYLKVWQWIWQGPEIWCKSSQVAIVACLMSPLAANFVNEQIKFHSEKSGRNFKQLVFHHMKVTWVSFNFWFYFNLLIMKQQELKYLHLSG